MIISVIVFVVCALILRVLAGGPLLALFENEVVSKTWVLPYLNMAAPDLVFFSAVGVLFPLAFKKHRLIPSAIVAGVGLLIGQFVLIQLHSSVVVYDSIGYLVLTAPFLGTVFGFAIGVLVSALVWRMLRRAPTADRPHSAHGNDSGNV